MHGLRALDVYLRCSPNDYQRGIAAAVAYAFSGASVLAASRALSAAGVLVAGRAEAVQLPSSAGRELAGTAVCRVSCRQPDSQALA
jgi:hypothetical protein